MILFCSMARRHISFAPQLMSNEDVVCCADSQLRSLSIVSLTLGLSQQEGASKSPYTSLSSAAVPPTPAPPSTLRNCTRGLSVVGTKKKDAGLKTKVSRLLEHLLDGSWDQNGDTLLLCFAGILVSSKNFRS